MSREADELETRRKFTYFVESWPKFERLLKEMPFFEQEFFFRDLFDVVKEDDKLCCKCDVVFDNEDVFYCEVCHENAVEKAKGN